MFINIIAILYWVTWLILTHIPHLGPLPDIPGKDKTIHFVGYCIGTLLLIAVLVVNIFHHNKNASEQKSEKKIGKRYWLLFALIISAMIIALLDELTQPWFNRTCSLGDWLADFGGILLGASIGIYLLTKSSIYGKMDNSSADMSEL